MTVTSEIQRTGAGRAAAFLGAFALMAGLVAGCTSDGGWSAERESQNTPKEPVVSQTWARASEKGANSAIYMTITGGGADDEVIGVMTDDDLADAVEVHETTVAEPSGSDDGSDNGTGMGSDSKMMSMHPVDSVAVPAGSTVTFEPGGYHVMLTGLHDDFSVGDSIGFTLKFKNAGEVHATAEVRES